MLIQGFKWSANESEERMHDLWAPTGILKVWE